MVISPALQRGERGQQQPVSPVGAMQNGELVIKNDIHAIARPSQPMRERVRRRGW
jgi:hypothetical protein